MSEYFFVYLKEDFAISVCVFLKLFLLTQNNNVRFIIGFRLIERLHHGGGSSLREVVAALEADMEAMYDMIDRFGGGNASAADGGSGGGARNRETSNATVCYYKQ